MTPNDERLLRLVQARARLRIGAADPVERALVAEATREDWLAIDALKETAEAAAPDPLDVGTYEAMCESPPERELLRGVFTYGYGSPLDARSFAVQLPSGAGAVVQPQRVVGGYRIDLALTAGPRRLAAEVDGFEHHDATPERAERDKGRQRALVAAGWVVVPFAAREVSRDPRRCALELLELASERRSA